MLAGQAGQRSGWRISPVRAPGFSVIEVVAVLVLLAVLGVAAFNSLSTSGTRAVAVADGLRAAIRYAQSRAMADVYTWGITISSNGYALYTNNPAAAGQALPGQGSNVYAMPSGVTLGGDAVVAFDWRGQPVTGNVTSPGGTATARTTPVGITVRESSTSVAVTVTPYTGFVP